MTTAEMIIKEVNPQGEDALALLREAAIEARELYPEFHRPVAPWPTNCATPPRGTYLIAYLDGEPVGCGALRPLDEAGVEVRRMFVVRRARGRNFGRAILRALEAAAGRFGYKFMRLETGNRQLPAMALYASYGFAVIEPFGEYVDDPTSVCYEKSVQPLSGAPEHVCS
jgi:GNAT superfamily N-acetyltransferase